MKGNIGTPLLAVLTLAMALAMVRGCGISGNPRREGLASTDKIVEVEKTRLVMGNIPLTIKLWGEKVAAERAMAAAFEAVEEVDRTCNLFNPNTELSRLNATAATRPSKCGPLLWDVLQRCRVYHKVSGGAFDITVAPLMNLWGFRRKRGEIPSDAEIAQTLKLVGFDKLEFDASNHTVRFAVAGMNLDLGGMAKGYAVDKAAEAALGNGIKSGLINLAGNGRCLPEPPPGKNTYLVGVRNPFDKKGVADTLNLLDASIATSGDYERFVILQGKRFSHIIDPRTGYPASGEHSVTVVSPLAVDADALSTTMFINGPAFAKRFHATHPDDKMVFITGADSRDMRVERIGF